MVNKLRDFFVSAGWLCIFALYPLGNTSLGIFLLLIALVLGYSSGDFRKKARLLEYKVLGVFCLIMLMSTFVAVKPLAALTMAFGQILIFFLVLHGASYLTENRNQFNRNLWVLFGFSLVSGGVAIYKYIQETRWTYRTETLFTGTNGTGTVLLVSLVLSLGLLMQIKSIKKRLVMFAVLLIPFAGMVLTFSRGAYLGFLGAILTFLNNSKKAVVLFLLFCLISVSIIMVFSPIGQQRLMSFFSAEKNESRMVIWKTTFRMIEDNFFTGVGTGMYAYKFPYYKPEGYERDMTLAHNLELQIFAEFGVFGLIAFLVLLILVLKRNFQLIKAFPDRLHYRGVLAVLVGYLIHNQVDGTMVGFEVGAFFWALCGFIIHEYYANLHNKEV